MTSRRILRETLDGYDTLFSMAEGGVWFPGDPSDIGIQDIDPRRLSEMDFDTESLNFWITTYNKIIILFVSSASSQRDNSAFSNLVGKQHMTELEVYYQLIMFSR